MRIGVILICFLIFFSSGYSQYKNPAVIGQESTLNSDSSIPIIQTTSTNPTIASPLNYSMYIGGSDDDYITNLASLTDGDLILTGLTRSKDFPTTPNALHPKFIESETTKYNAVLMRITPNGTLVWSTYLYPIKSPAEGNIPLLVNWQVEFSLLKIDQNDNLFVSFSAPQENQTNPTTAFMFDIYLSKLSSDGDQYWETLIGGSNIEEITSIKFDYDGNILLGGQSFSDDMPGKLNQNRGGRDSILTKVDTSGKVLWSRYFGGTGNEQSNFFDISSQNDIFIEVADNSDTTSFTTTNSTYNSENYYGDDTYFAKISSQGDVIWDNFISTPNGNEYCHEVYVNTSDDSFYILISSDSKTLKDIPIILGDNLEAYYWYHFTKDGKFIESILDYKYDPANWDGIDTTTDVWDRQSLKEFDGYFVEYGRMIRPVLNTSADAIQKNLSTDALDGSIRISTQIGSYPWSTYFGSQRPDQIYDVTSINNQFTNKQQFAFVGTSEKSIIGATNSLHGKFDGYLALISNPLLDTDHDQISDYWEDFYKMDPLDQKDAKYDTDNDGLSNLQEFKINTNPTSIDSDLDLIDDLWEVHYGFDPNDPTDALSDIDKDELNNLVERFVGTNPLDPDTDSDLIKDGYEIKYELNPLDPVDAQFDPDDDGLTNYQESVILTNPRLMDTETDGMPDGWEVKYHLDPLRDDANEDADEDGLSNLREYQEFSQPNTKDTDGDGMDDYWEVKYDLDPSFRDDANWDGDDDGLPNYWEYRLHSDPTSFSWQVYLGLILVIIAIYLGSTQLLALHRNVIVMGFSSYFDYRWARKYGFATKAEQEEAHKNGYLHSNIIYQLQALQCKNTDEILSKYLALIIDITSFQEINSVENVTSTLEHVKTPQMVSEQYRKFIEIKSKLELYQNQSIALLSFINFIAEIERVIKRYPLVKLKKTELNDMQANVDASIRSLTRQKNSLTQIYQKTMDWFEPWSRILALIQITEDGLPTSLQEISEIVNTTDIHTEQLLILLLEENPLIGTYNPETKIYTKGVMIEHYINLALEILSDLHDD